MGVMLALAVAMIAWSIIDARIQRVSSSDDKKAEGVDRKR